MKNLTKNHTLILSEILDCPYIGDDINFGSYRVVRDNVSYKFDVADIKVDSEEGDISAVFTLPNYSNRVFLTVSNGMVSELLKILSELDDYNSFTKKLKNGDTARLNLDYLKENNYVGVILFDVNRLSMFDSLFTSKLLKDKDIHFSYVCFINLKEYEIKKEKGLDALLEYFSEIQKDLIDF